MSCTTFQCLYLYPPDSLSCVKFLYFSNIFVCISMYQLTNYSIEQICVPFLIMSKKSYIYTLCTVFFSSQSDINLKGAIAFLIYMKYKFIVYIHMYQVVFLSAIINHESLFFIQYV